LSDQAQTAAETGALGVAAVGPETTVTAGSTRSPAGAIPSVPSRYRPITFARLVEPLIKKSTDINNNGGTVHKRESHVIITESSLVELTLTRTTLPEHGKIGEVPFLVIFSGTFNKYNYSRIKNKLTVS